MDVMLAKYQRQKSGGAYSRFRQEVPVIGIWDDHDYGVNDGGKEYPQKEASSALLMDFLDVPRDAEVRERAGVYQSYSFGPEGEQIKIILLDTRYFRDPLEKQSMTGPRYYPNPQGDILGEVQWEWLERELTQSSAQIHLIGTSIQLIAEEQFFEKWANFPTARDRFFRLLEKTKPSRPILISGDRHISELSRIQLPGLERPLYELTSSGMTHTWSSAGAEPNRYRVGDLIIAKAFGLIQIDWSGAEPSLSVRVHRDTGEELLNEILY
jgi:alkaline phosphatase D